jgi:hypothetical protein
METDCPCDICVAEARGCHPWELLFREHPRAIEAIRQDWEETKALDKNRMQPIYYYDLLKDIHGQD